MKVSNPRIRVFALKKAEQGDEVILRLVELDGKPQAFRVSFAASLTAAREVNGQEQPLGPATVTNGALVTSFAAYQPRTFAIRLAAPRTTLRYDIATASNDGTPSSRATSSVRTWHGTVRIPRHTDLTAGLS